jgi:hypothetical protein
MAISLNRLGKELEMLCRPDRQGSILHRTVCTTIRNEYREIRLVEVCRAIGR